MISAFLFSLATQVRHLVEAKRTVHVTEETARELDILAGLPWKQALRHKVHLDPTIQEWVCSDCDAAVGAPGAMETISPADFALGLLLSSKAVVAESSEIRFDEQCDRAAVCAELAVLCERMQAEPIAHITLADANIPIYRGMTGDVITHLLRVNGSGATASGAVTLPAVGSATGTREGARACWGFVCEGLQKLLNEPLGDNADEQQWGAVLAAPPNWPALNAKVNPPLASFAETYRRELEAMR